MWAAGVEYESCQRGGVNVGEEAVRCEWGVDGVRKKGTFLLTGRWLNSL